MDTDRISVSQMDYLDEDKPIKGQNYALMSFISPEDVLQDKEVFFYSKFLQSLSGDLKKMFDGFREKYPDDKNIIDQVEENNKYFFNNNDLQEQYKFFKSINLSDMDNEFHQNNKYKTTIRGIKVRGVFDTMNEAKIRAEVLKRMGDKFDIFVGQVGCWCPWSPNPEDLQDQEYAETELNTLMKKYKENASLKDAEFEQRKQDKIEKAKAEFEAKKLAQNLSNVTIEDTPQPSDNPETSQDTTVPQTSDNPEPSQDTTE